MNRVSIGSSTEEKQKDYTCLSFSLQALQKIHVRQKHLLTAIACEAELLHDLRLLGLGHTGPIKVRPRPIGVSLKFLETLLVIQPLVGQQLPTIHATYRDDHTYHGHSFDTDHL